jgi:hypothetical protein
VGFGSGDTETAFLAGRLSDVGKLAYVNGDLHDAWPRMLRVLSDQLPPTSATPTNKRGAVGGRRSALRGGADIFKQSHNVSF